jgi:hypothetical protein
LSLDPFGLQFFQRNFTGMTLLCFADVSIRLEWRIQLVFPPERLVSLLKTQEPENLLRPRPQFFVDVRGVFERDWERRQSQDAGRPEAFSHCSSSCGRPWLMLLGLEERAWTRERKRIRPRMGRNKRTSINNELLLMYLQL